MSPTLSKCFAAAALCALPLAVGCGTGSNQIPVSGTVTYDGQPVTEGTITFMPVSGEGQTTGAEIVDGKYATAISPGEQAVQIYGTRTTTKSNPTPEEVARGLAEETEQYVPAKYNSASELRVTITEDSSEENFDLLPAEGS